MVTAGEPFIFAGEPAKECNMLIFAEESFGCHSMTKQVPTSLYCMYRYRFHACDLIQSLRPDQMKIMIVNCQAHKLAMTRIQGFQVYTRTNIVQEVLWMDTSSENHGASLNINVIKLPNCSPPGKCCLSHLQFVPQVLARVQNTNQLLLQNLVRYCEELALGRIFSKIKFG